MNDISLQALIELSVDLTNSLTDHDRFNRLLSTVRQTINCDAVVLLAVQQDFLKPLAQQGLTHDSLGRRFNIADHPRFEKICHSLLPVRFPANSPLPDPYDGMLLSSDHKLPIHACMGLPLLSDDQLIGILTLDSLTPHVFNDISERTLEIISVMSAAALKTAILLQRLEDYSQHKQQVVEELTQEALSKDGGELIGASSAMVKLKQDIKLVAPSDFSVLIEGETGVGKELVARTIHQYSHRHHGPLVHVNCAAIPENLIESELFGHVKGAFTGAHQQRAGKFSLAHEGTIFLDEIGELPLVAQSKLLRVLQNQEIQPVGQDTTEIVNVRILAATNRQLINEVEKGRFRADLFHRLSVYPIHVPPLRERNNDTSLLAGYFSEQVRRKLGLQQLTIDSKAITRLSQYLWPGNIRELEHVISRAALKAKSDATLPIVNIQESHLEHLNTSISPSTPTQQIPPASPINLKQVTEQFQRQLISEYLEQTQGNWSATAKLLQIDRANLSRLAKRLGIQVQKHVTSNQNNSEQSTERVT